MSKQLRGVRAESAFSYRSLEEVAASVRRCLRLKPCEQFDAQEFFEFSKLTIEHDGCKIPVITGVDALPDLTEALTRFDPDSERIEILLSEQSYEMLHEGKPRGKYTISHELGHAVLHTGALIRLARLNESSQFAFHRGKPDHPAYLDTEWQANAFGAALLMPAAGIHDIETHLNRTISDLDVALEFGTSRESAHYRLQVYKAHRSELI
jgi:hypothetical protein